jgi:hypothetical protein
MYRFSGRAPDVNPVEVKTRLDEICKAFYYSKAKYKFLIISELKILMGVLARVDAKAPKEFSSFLASIACGGASSHQYVWIDTNVVGLAENGFNGVGDRDAFELDWIVTEKNASQITSHVSFVGNKHIPSRAFGTSGRAFSSSGATGWHPVPNTYEELDATLRQAHPPTIPMQQQGINEQPLPEITQEEAENLAFTCEGAIRCQNAISLSLEAIGDLHAGVKQMLESPEYRPVLIATLNKAGELGLLRVVEFGGSYTVGLASKRSKQATN